MTQREQQVLAMIGRGYSIPKIAEKLFRSQKTIETHRQSLGRKLGASNRVELARIAIQVGLAPLDVAGTRGSELHHDVRQQLGVDAHAAGVVSAIESACASVVDLAYGQALCESLTSSLGVTGAALMQWDDEGVAVRSLAWWYRGAWVDEATIEVAGTACETYFAQDVFRIDHHEGCGCPGLTDSEAMGIRGCMGCRLDDPLTQESVGVLMVFSDQSADFEPVVETAMRVCAVRASGELSRVRLIDSLQRSVESLEERLAVLEGDDDDSSE
ncbi:MAG: LuxR C-terminal-related transcriptional regulator [Planctomycetota bacterium]